MYKLNNLVISDEELATYAKDNRMTIPEFISTYGWRRIEGKTNGSTKTTPPAGPRIDIQPSGESASEDISLVLPKPIVPNFLQNPDNYFDEDGNLKSIVPEDTQYEDYQGQHGEDENTILAPGRSAKKKEERNNINAEIRQSSFDEAENIIKLQQYQQNNADNLSVNNITPEIYNLVINRVQLNVDDDAEDFGGAVKYNPEYTAEDYEFDLKKKNITTADDIEFTAQELNLRGDVKSSNIQFNPEGDIDIISKYFGDYGYSKFKDFGINAIDFVGYLKRIGEYEDLVADYNDIYEGQEDDSKLALDKENRIMPFLNSYLASVQEAGAYKLFYEDYIKDPLKYSDASGFGGAYAIYLESTKENPVPVNVWDLDENKIERLNNFAPLNQMENNFRRNVEEAQYNRRKENTGLEQILSPLLAGVSNLLPGAYGAVEDIVDLAGSYIPGTDNFYKKKRARDKYNWNAYSSISYARVEGMGIKHSDGIEYVLDDEGFLYDVTNGARVDNFLDPKKKAAIIEEIKANGTKYSDYSSYGMMEQAGYVMGNVATQIILTELTGGALSAASLGTLAKLNGFKNVSQFKKYLNLTKARGFTNMKGVNAATAKTFGLALPGKSQGLLSAAIAQGAIGASSGYKNTMAAAEAAGLTPEEARALARQAQVEYGAMYIGTSFINPQIGVVDDFFSNTAQKSLVNKAIRNYVGGNGSTSAFRRTLTNGLAEVTERGINYVRGGAKETVQENIQQGLETTLINARLNERAGKDILEDTYSANDFYVTSALSFGTGGIFEGAGRTVTSQYKALPTERFEQLQIMYSNRKASVSMINAAVDQGKINKDQAADIISQMEAVGKHGGKLPTFMLNSQADVVEMAVNLNKIDNLEQSKKNVDKAFHAEIDEQIKALEDQNTQIKEDAKTKITTAEIETVQKLSGDVQTFKDAKEMEDAGIDPNKANADGFFEGEGGKIFINLDQTQKAGAISVASHELLHRALQNELVNNKENLPKVINELRDLLDPRDLARLDERAQSTREDGSKVYEINFNEDGSVEGADIDEYITFLSDAIARKEIVYTNTKESLFSQIGRGLINQIRTLGGRQEVKFKTGKQVFDFVKDYRTSLGKGKLSVTAKAKLRASKDVKTEDKLSVSQLDNKLKENYDNNPRKLVNDMLTFPLQESNFAKEIGGITENITKRLYDPIPADQKQTLTRAEFKDALIGEAATLVTNEYKVGEQNLDKFVSTRLNLRANNLASRLGIEAAITEDVSERKDIQADQDIEAEIDKPADTKTEFKKLSEYKGNQAFINEDAMPEVERAISRIVGAPSFTAKFDQRAPDGKQTSDFIAALKKQFGNSILVDRIKAKAIVKSKTGTTAQAFERFMVQNKKAILENMTTTYLQTAFPHAVEKSVSGVFVRFPGWLGQKIDRETTGQGNDLVRRVPNVAQAISDEQYLEDIRTNPLKGGKEVRSAAKQNSVFKAIAEEIGIEMVTEAIKNPDSEIYKALSKQQANLGVSEDQINAAEAMVQAERGNVKFSDGTQELLIGNTQQISDEFLDLEGRNKTDTLLKRFKLEGVYKFKTTDQVNEFVKDLQNGTLKTMPKSFWFPTEKGSVLLHSAKIIGASSSDPVWKYYQQEINKLRKLDDSNFGPPIIDKNGNEITDFNSYINKYNTLFGSEAKVLANLENGKIEEFNNSVSAIHEAMWMRFRDAIKQNKNNARPIAQFLNFSTSNRNHWQRLGAQFVGYSKGFKPGKGNVTFEHAMPNIAAYLYLLDAAVNNYNFEGAYNAIMSNYKLIALDKESDNKLSGAYKTGMPKGWSVTSGYWFQRYFNEVIAANDGGIDPNSIVLLDGRTLAEAAGVSADGTIKSAKGIEFNNQINQEALQKASENIKELNKAPKTKLSVTQQQDLNIEFNNILERKTGVESFKTFSAAQAQMRGAKKGKFKFFIAPAVDDFRGLVNYAFAGRGKQGEADMKWMEDKLMTPYAKGIAAIDGVRQQIKRDFKSLVSTFPQQYKQLNKEIGDSGFTFDQAVRVYLWQKAGLEIPGLSKKDTKLLNDAIQGNPELIDFANSLLAVARRDQWMEPGQHWLGGTVLSDLSTMTEKVGRKEYLSEFIENADIIFSPENLNKIEALFGKAHREAIQDSLYSMKNGTNRQQGQNKIVGKWLNWLNGSTGAIMFFNRRSALLQMLSATNFINWSDNNILKAGAAFANQKQFWTDWAMIYNSDKLKERRGGLRQDVSANEIASVANESKNSPQAIIAYLLKIGFKPTQLADSFAIASGGAAFYRNRVNTYLNEGLDQKAAEEQAFIDFSKKSDEAQQSSDPALVSQVQRSVLGRLVFAFQNTPMQYARLMKKAALDLKNGRGDWKENVSKIAYYGAIQNLIFSSLQSALFALIPGFDDEDEDLTDKELEKRNEQDEAKIARVLNSMVDTILRGSGIYGAVFATTKNAIREYMRQDKKDFMADHTYSILSLTDISPPISSKLRKIYSAIQTRRFEKDEIAARGWAITGEGRLDLGPNWSILGKVTSATVNLPLDRAVDELTSISEAFDARNTAYQRIALGLGWKTWDVRAKDELGEAIRSEAKEKRKEEGKKKAAETRKRKAAEKKAIEDAMTPAEKEAKKETKRKEKLAQQNKTINDDSIVDEKAIYALNKNQQFELLQKYGILLIDLGQYRTEKQRVNKIIELRNKIKK
jgi:hypothetical protein